MEAAPQRTISDIPINICIWASLLLLLLRSEKKRIKQPDERKQKEEVAAVASPCWMIKIRLSRELFGLTRPDSLLSLDAGHLCFYVCHYVQPLCI